MHSLISLVNDNRFKEILVYVYFGFFVNNQPKNDYKWSFDPM